MAFIDPPAPKPLRGLDYAWRDTGPREAPTVVLLHGLLDNAASFAPLVEALEQRLSEPHRFIAPDWRGHGATAWAADGDYWFPQYLADLDALLTTTVDRQPVTLVGHSMGGQVASLFAGTRPDRVTRLIALDSLNVPDSESAKAPGRYQRWLDAQAQPPTPRIYASIADISARIGQRYPELGRDQRDFLAQHWSQPIDDGPRCRMRADPWHRATLPYGFRATEAMAIWQQITAPVLCIDGGQSPASRFTPESTMSQRRACFASLQRVVIEYCGHMLHLQAPTAVAEAMAGFIESSPRDQPRQRVHPG